MMNTQYIEKILIDHPTVREVCVVPASKEDVCYRFHAFVTLVDDTPDAIYTFQAESQELLEGIAVRVEILSELPKSGLGRISRDALRLLCDEVGV
jgi:acyl-coenzyme A synthetase/AMP-(fatty) acid ligase